MKSTFVAIALSLGITFSIFAGGRQEAAGKVTIRFEGAEQEFPQEFIENYNASHPDIQVIRIEPEWTRLIADMIAGTASDLILMGSGTDVAYFSLRGLLLDITDRLNKSALIRYEDIDLPGNSSYRFDGQEWGKGPWYGLCKDYNNIGCITYNKKMFAEAGLSPLSECVPILYRDDLFSLARKLTKKDAEGRNLVWGYDVDPYWIPFLVSDMATAEGLSLYGDNDRSVLNEDPRVRGLWKYWLRFPLADISSNIRNIVPNWPGASFPNDRVAMVQLGYWFGAVLLENDGYETKYGWAPTPILRPGAKRVTNTLGATGVSIYSKTKYPNQAFGVFEYYMAGEFGVHRARTGWGIPPLLSLRRYLPEDNEYNRSRKRVALDDAKYFVPWQATPYTWGALTFDDWDNCLKDLIEGVVDQDTFVDRMYQSLNGYMKRGKEELGM